MGDAAPQEHVAPPAPFRLAPIIVAKPWGGRRLAGLGRDLPPEVLVGESWDVADLPAGTTTVAEPVTVVSCGPHAGLSLTEVVGRMGEALLGPAGHVASSAGPRRFPLLVKHLDAREHLSVQVHPTAAMVARQPQWHVKDESWVVVCADPGAELFLGVADGVGIEDVRRTAGTPQVVPLLRRVPARVGDVHHLPAGLVHALGAGVVVAEPQTPSDTTFRLYDWTAEYARSPRDLHVEDALEAMRSAWHLNVAVPRPAPGDGLLVDAASYRLSRTTSPAGGVVAVVARRAVRVVVVVTGQLDVPGLDGPLGPGGVAVVPACWSGRLVAGPGTSWLDVDLVSAAAS